MAIMSYLMTKVCVLEVLALIRLYLEDQIVIRSETPMPESTETSSC